MNLNIPQNYSNHRSYDYLHIGAAISLLSAALVCLALLFGVFPANAAARITPLLLLYLVLLNLVILYKVRIYPLLLQDRIIMLEMKLRLQKLLPREEHWQIEGLSKNQMIALHYASDEELPELMLKVLDQHIQDRDVMKQMIKHWRGDYERI